ncbi:MAG: VWA domain-containing protein [Pyrinomonadaceae bacterium]|nr:VWA domain-containing protein [Pyrinomonadaceae bacterium]
MRVRLLFLLITAAIALPFSARAQDPKADDVIKVDTQIVDVPLAVLSPAGVPVRGLKATNFVVYEDGKRQAIADFSSTAEPFEVALLLDTSGSARNDLQLIKRAALAFIRSLRLGDRVAIIAYRTERDEQEAYSISEVLNPLTSERAKLEATVERVRTSNSTPYYDSLEQIVEKVFGDRPSDEFRGRRALVALTDGVDSSSAADFESAKEMIESSGLIAFFIKVDTREFFESNLLGDCEMAIRFSSAQIRRYYRSIKAKPGMERAVSFCDLGEFERLAVSKRLYELADTEMADLAKASGGRVFPIGDLSDARAAFKGVADEIGTKYTLAYYPSNTKKDGTYRKLRVDVTGLPKGTVVRAREGYTAPLN